MKLFSITHYTFAAYVMMPADSSDLEIRHKAARELDSIPTLYAPEYNRPEARVAIYFGKVNR